MYSDLATINNLTDMNSLNVLVSNAVARAWIGLEAGNVWIWHWSWPDQKLDFLNWRAGEPQDENKDACGAMDQQGKWFESDCGTKRSFVCHGNGEASDYIFISETKSWRDAQKHCRDLASDLITIRSAEKNEAVRNTIPSLDVWIGLFKDPWKWSDGSNSSFRHWKPAQPNYLQGQDCVAVVFNDGRWNDLKCSGKRNFVCQGERKSVSETSDETSTRDTITTDQLPVNVTTLPNNSGPGKETFTSTVTSLSFSNATDVTTNEATTVSPQTTANTTDFPSVTSSTELNNATTELSNVTAVQLPPTTTAQATTEGVSSLTTLMGTTALNTTQMFTPNPTENSLLPGHLVLIQENMTWIEALSYCRKHHIDLVHISNRDVQERVAEKASNATSVHVWLGLRYTCKFNFWFWIQSPSGCYLNWAPGQGSEREYGCGATGAIQATGGQQWVGLPETEKLNFICHTCAR
ncbi:uncharacterized protein V6R79_017551 [Siganus canaliculatus]